MATFNLRRFSSQEALRTIAPNHMIEFLTRHKAFFVQRGLALPAPAAAETLDYERLVAILMSPEDDTPPELAEALYLIHEMSTKEGMDSILEGVKAGDVKIDDSTELTPADVAVQVWLSAPEYLERKHAEQSVEHTRSFEYFQSNVATPPRIKRPTAAVQRALEKSLDDWFEEKKRGRGAKVITFPKGDEVWFLVRHGDLLKREGKYEHGESSTFVYRPEKYDVLVYNQQLGELRIHADTKGEKSLYRAKFGLHLFGREDFFPGQAKYTLKPLIALGKDSLTCGDIEGIDDVRLVELQIARGGPHQEIEIRKATDLFAVLEARGRSIHEKARLTKAKFRVKFTASKTPRTVTVKPPNVVLYGRDSDSALVEAWLTARGFIGSVEQADGEHKEVAAAVANA